LRVPAPAEPHTPLVPTRVEVAVFVTRRAGSETLILHRSPEQGGYWHVVAGGVESGETAAQAAERELHEETGLSAKPTAGVEVVEYVHRASGQPATRPDQCHPSVADVDVTCFHVTAPDEWEPRLDWEHDDCRWCAPSEAFALLRWPATAHALRMLLVPRRQQ
jgi:8-oxo-dGTP pyrophosphatase MutT (NUDIX family)